MGVQPPSPLIPLPAQGRGQPPAVAGIPGWREGPPGIALGHHTRTPRPSAMQRPRAAQTPCCRSPFDRLRTSGSEPRGRPKVHRSVVERTIALRRGSARTGMRILKAIRVPFHLRVQISGVTGEGTRELAFSASGPREAPGLRGQSPDGGATPIRSHPPPRAGEGAGGGVAPHSTRASRANTEAISDAGTESGSNAVLPLALRQTQDEPESALDRRVLAQTRNGRPCGRPFR